VLEHRVVMSRYVAWKRIWAIAAVVSAVALLCLACTLKPWQNASLGPPTVNLGTAQMQAEIMALAIRNPILPPPPRSLPVPMAMGGRGAARADRWRPEVQRQLSDPVPAATIVIDQTLPYCQPGGHARFCQDDDDLVDWVEERPMYQLRRQLQAQLPLANRRSRRVPDAALEGAAHLGFVQLRTIQKQGCQRSATEESLEESVILLLSMPVFSADNQWAMIAVAADYCSSIGGQRSRMLFHREEGRWVLERPELALSGIRRGRALWPGRG